MVKPVTLEEYSKLLAEMNYPAASHGVSKTRQRHYTSPEQASVYGPAGQSRSGFGQTNFDKALPSEMQAQAKLAVKDEYTFDFLELGEEHSERALERALIGKIEHFLREMGGMFA